MASSKNPLASLIGHYDSDNDSEDEALVDSKAKHFMKRICGNYPEPLPSATEPLDSNMVLQCAWSACYDESSGYTYYWNQYTNQVTWEPPPEYLQAIKMASLQATKAQSEVSSEEWQMYQQVLAEQQTTTTKSKPAAPALDSKLTKSKFDKRKKRRQSSDTEDEKIELITSYYNSDSESNDENEKVIVSTARMESTKSDKQHVSKKVKNKHEVPASAMEYGPSLPLNQQYTSEPEPKFLQGPITYTKTEENHSKLEKIYESPVDKMEERIELVSNGVLLSNGEAKNKKEETLESTSQTVVEQDSDSEDSPDESVLIRKLAEKTEILKNLGGEVPTEINDLLKFEPGSRLCSQSASTQCSPKTEDVNESIIDNDLHKQVELFEKSVDEMLAEIESKELKNKQTFEKSDDNTENTPSSHSMEDSKLPLQTVTIDNSDNKYPSSVIAKTVLFPSASTAVLFPSAQNINISKIASAELISKTDITERPKSPSTTSEPEIVKVLSEKKGANLYMRSPSEEVEIITKRKKRIATDVLPEVRKEKRRTVDVLPEVKKEKKVEKSATPSYTTKYSQYIDGFSSERTGLGFSTISEQDETFESDKKKAFVYGKYSKPVVMFTKGEVLHEEKKDLEAELPKEEIDNVEDKEETSESLAETLQAKLKFLNQNSVELPPVQEMIIQFECLSSAYSAGALLAVYWRSWLETWARALHTLEARAAPQGWHCRFQREEGRYQYKRVSDGFLQWDYPQEFATDEEVNDDDMDICTTPPPCDVLPDPMTPVQMHTRNPAVKTVTHKIVAPVSIMASTKQNKSSVPRERVNPPLPCLSPSAPPPPSSWESTPPPPPPPPVPPPPSHTPPPPPPPSSLRPPPPPKNRRHASPPPPPPGTDEEEHAMYTLPAGKECADSPPPLPPPPPTISQNQTLGDELMSFYSDLAELEKQPEPSPPEAPYHLPEAPYHPSEAQYHPPEPSRQKTSQPTDDDQILNSLWSTAKKVELTKKLATEPVSSPKLKDSNDGIKIKKKTKVKLSSSVGLKNKNVSSLVAKWQQVKDANKDDDDD